jgi:trigger factor
VHIEGLKKDDSKEFTLKVPDDYGDGAIAGKDCRFSVTVLEIKEKALANLDDEFAKGVGDGYETLEALRESVLTNLTERAERTSKRAFQENNLTQVINGASIEVPGLVTEREIDHMLEEQLQAIRRRRIDMDTYLKDVGKSPEELREALRPAAKERLTRALVLRKLAKDGGIEVSDEEIDGEIEDLASSSGESGDGLRQMFSSDNARSSVGNAILQRKVLEHLAEIIQMEAEDSAPDVQEDEASGPEETEPPVETESEDETSFDPPEGQKEREASQGESAEETSAP